MCPSTRRPTDPPRPDAAKAPKRGRGRPTKLIPATERRLIVALARGESYAGAAAFARIAESTLHQWRAEFPEFSERLEAAARAAEHRVVRRLLAHTDQSWQACIAFLERRYPDEWGRRDRSTVTHDGQVGVPVRITHIIDMPPAGTDLTPPPPAMGDDDGPLAP